MMQIAAWQHEFEVDDMKPVFAICALSLGALVLAGCQSARLDGVTTQQGTLAPVGGAVAPVAGGTQFPNAPVAPVAPTDSTMTPVTPAAGTQVASVATGPAVSEDALVGAWKVTTAGSSCQMFMAKTKWSGGFRAASRGCPGDAAAVSAWTVSGSQVILKDSNGNQVATLFSSGGTRFDGTTKGGQPISLSR
jgi:hypothetical protein